MTDDPIDTADRIDRAEAYSEARRRGQPARGKVRVKKQGATGAVIDFGTLKGARHFDKRLSDAIKEGRIPILDRWLREGDCLFHDAAWGAYKALSDRDQSLYCIERSTVAKDRSPCYWRVKLPRRTIYIRRGVDRLVDRRLRWIFDPAGRGDRRSRCPRQRSRFDSPERILEIGLVYEFGHLCDPREEFSASAFAMAFKMKKGRVRQRLRDYKRITLYDDWNGGWIEEFWRGRDEHLSRVSFGARDT